MASESALKNVPAHVAIIMDGNGRWAQERELPRLVGHRAGTKNLHRIIRTAADAGIKHLTFYAFSTENWNRPEDEIKGLMALLAEFLESEIQELHKEGARLLHIGHLDGLGPTLKKKVVDAIELTKNNTHIDVILAFNYGGRDEIVCAIKKLIEEDVKPEEIDIERVSQAMFTAGTPDPDIVIRTSGEQRTSNFLVWQTVYSEWFFPPVYWPDFNGDHLLQILEDFSKRDRRFGGLSKK